MASLTVCLMGSHWKYNIITTASLGLSGKVYILVLVEINNLGSSVHFTWISIKHNPGS